MHTKTTKGQYSPLGLKLARLLVVSSLLHGTRAMLVLNFPASKNKKYTAYDHFHRKNLYGKIPTKKEPIRTLRFTSRLPCLVIKLLRTCNLKFVACLTQQHSVMSYRYTSCSGFKDVHAQNVPKYSFF